MRRSVVSLGTALLLAVGAPALAQAPAPVAPPPIAPMPAPAVPLQTLYATHTVNIRQDASTHSPVIGKVEGGTAVQVTGPVPGSPRWVQLASGGFVSVSAFSPTPYHHHPHPQAYTAFVPPPGDFPVGSCQPYSKVINLAGQPPQQITGQACKQPDGTWKIVNYGVPQPVQPAPPPVIVQQQPVVVQPAPVVVAPPPYYYGPGPYRYYR